VKKPGILLDLVILHQLLKLHIIEILEFVAADIAHSVEIDWMNLGRVSFTVADGAGEALIVFTKILVVLCGVGGLDPKQVYSIVYMLDTFRVMQCHIDL